MSCVDSGEVVLVGDGLHVRNVGGEESRDDEDAFGGKVAGVGGHVGSEDVFVDVGDDGVECACDGSCIAEQYGGTCDVVEGEVFVCVCNAVRIYVDGHNRVGSPLSHGNGENSCACTHVENPLMCEVMVLEEVDYLVCGGVSARAEGHAGTQKYAELALENGVEVILFPFGIPVFIFKSVDGVGKLDGWDGEVGEEVLQGLRVEVGLWDVGFESCGCAFEGFVADVGEQGGKNVAGVVGVGCDSDVGVEVLHELMFLRGSVNFLF